MKPTQDQKTEAFAGFCLVYFIVTSFSGFGCLGLGLLLLSIAQAIGLAMLGSVLLPILWVAVFGRKSYHSILKSILDNA
jgi:hypothetical protein